mmetsp:Transcript_54206/g.117153  ORF Transcript_54206/g.117153 Transcript_54206/m.117153 type:complete len:102 (+) Transcript_54206:392-697(+)
MAPKEYKEKMVQSFCPMVAAHDCWLANPDVCSTTLEWMKNSFSAELKASLLANCTEAGVNTTYVAENPADPCSASTPSVSSALGKESIGWLLACLGLIWGR